MDQLNEFVNSNPVVKAAYEAAIQAAATEAARAATEAADAALAAERNARIKAEEKAEILEEAVRIAGESAKHGASANLAAADQNFAWYVPFMKMSCREQAAHVSNCYSC